MAKRRPDWELCAGGAVKTPQPPLPATTALRMWKSGKPETETGSIWWTRSTSPSRRARRRVNETLPEDGYVRLLFKTKCDAVFGHVLELASHGRKWAA